MNSGGSPSHLFPPEGVQLPVVGGTVVGGVTAGGLVVRRAVGADAVVLHEVAAATFPLACPPDSTRQNIEAFIAANLTVEVFEHHLADPERTIFLAEVAGAGAGYTMLIAGEPHDPDVAAAVIRRPTIELSKFYVMPEQHGRGVAHALMSATVDEAGWRGARSIWLGVNDQNARANRFYEKSGFAFVGSKRFLLGDRWEGDFVRERVL